MPQSCGDHLTDHSGLLDTWQQRPKVGTLKPVPKRPRRTAGKPSKLPKRDAFGRFVGSKPNRDKPKRDDYGRFIGPGAVPLGAPKRDATGRFLPISPLPIARRKPTAKRKPPTTTQRGIKPVSLAEQIRNQFSKVKPRFIEQVDGRVNTRTGEFIPFRETRWRRYDVGTNPKTLQRTLSKYEAAEAAYLWLHFKDKTGADQWRSTGAVQPSDDDAVDILSDFMDEMVNRYATAGVVNLGSVEGVELNLLYKKS